MVEDAQLNQARSPTGRMTTLSTTSTSYPGIANERRQARLRDLLANNNALLAYTRAAVSFAGLGFAMPISG